MRFNAKSADISVVRRGKACGVTLFELLVVILLLGLLSGVVGLTLGSTPRVAALDPATVAVLQARDSALRSGHPVTISLTVDGLARLSTAFPDGRVLTDAPLGIDPQSGSPVFLHDSGERRPGNESANGIGQ